MREFDKIDFLFSKTKALLITDQHMNTLEIIEMEQIAIYNQVLNHLKIYCDHKRNSLTKVQGQLRVDSVSFTGDYAKDVQKLFEKVETYAYYTQQQKNL